MPDPAVGGESEDSGGRTGERGPTGDGANQESRAQARGRPLGQVFWAAIAVGLLLIVAGGIAFVWRDIGHTEARLVLCTGIGILLGAFGSMATIKYKGVTVAGAAAIVITLVILLWKVTEPQVTFGRISGDIRGAQIEVYEDQSYLGAFPNPSKPLFKFIVEGDTLGRDTFSVVVSFPADDEGKGEQEFNFEGIDKKHIETYLGSGRIKEWAFRRGRQILEYADGSGLIARIGPPGESRGPSGASLDRSWWRPRRSWAQAGARDLGEIFGDLRSGSTGVRRAARIELAARGPSAVPAMMSELRQRQSSYRTRLGILVALSTMLRNDRSLAPAISRGLSSSDRQLIRRYAADSDRTVRAYAERILSDLR